MDGQKETVYECGVTVYGDLPFEFEETIDDEGNIEWRLIDDKKSKD